MALWENLGKKASESTAKAVQKAKELSETSRLSSVISEEEKKINNNYSQLGKLYVSIHPNDYEEEFAGMINSINESEEKIKDYRKQIQDIKGVLRCEKCGAEVQKGVAFCSSCAAPMPNMQAVNTEEFVACEGCGSMVKKGMHFCTTCGKSMVPPVEQPPSELNQTAEEIQEKICPGCGAKSMDDSAFCAGCGTKL